VYECECVEEWDELIEESERRELDRIEDGKG
jgi:hypothetical protein